MIPGASSLKQSLVVNALAIDSDDVAWLDGGGRILQLKSGRWKYYAEFPAIEVAVDRAVRPESRLDLRFMARPERFELPTY